VTALLVFGSGLAFVLLWLGKHPIRWSYPLDDAYISMTWSRNLVQHGSWGLNPGEFDSAASSPLWLLLQAAVMKILGAQVWIAFAMSMTCAIGLLLWVNFVGQREGWPDYFRTIVLALLVIIMPLVPLAFLGLEHILHTILTLWTLYIFWRLPERGQPDPQRYVARLLTAVLLTTAVRFEGMFLALALAAVLLWTRRPFLAGGVVCASFIPVAVQGFVSVAHGWSWLPSSVMLKSVDPIRGQPLEKAWAILLVFVRQISRPHIICALAVVFAVLWMLPGRRQGPDARVLGVFLLMFAQHMALARIGWFFRYEAYLIAASIFVVGLLAGPAMPPPAVLFRHWKEKRRVIKCLALALALGLWLPQFSYGLYALYDTPIAMKNSYDQQCQMAAFVQRYYRGSTVGVNDIGAVSFLAQAHVIDLWGLAHHTIYKARLAGQFDTKLLQRVCDEEKVQMAMVYDEWFVGNLGLPPNWRRVGFLRIENNLVCASGVVSFYAVNAAAAAKMTREFREFAACVPADVHLEPQ
jgi:hypothetical protein